MNETGASQLHIAFLADAVFEDLPGGSRVVARELACGLASLGHRVTFVVAAQGGARPSRSEKDGIGIVRYGGARNPGAFVSEGRRAVRDLCAQTRVDVVHTHFAYAALGPLAEFPKGTPHVRTFHGPWDSEGWVEDTAGQPSPIRLGTARLKRVGRRWVERHNLVASERVVVLSEYFRRELVERFHLPHARIDVIPGGVDLDRFKPAADKAAVREALGWETNGKVILSVRRLAPRMGLDRLIRAMPDIVSQVPDALLLIGGKGPERAHLESLIVDLGMQQHVRLLGFISDADLPLCYQAADLFVLPTVALEGFGLVTLEALASGLPVIGSNVGATPEILMPLSEDLLVDEITPEALAGATTRFFKMNMGCKFTREILRKYAEDNYSWKAHIDGMLRVYRDVLRHSKAVATTGSGPLR